MPSRTWPDFQLGHQLFLGFGLFALQHGAAAEHEIALFGIGLGDDAGEFLIDELRQVLDPIHRNLAGRNETAQAIHFALQPALVVSGHAGFDDHAFGHFRPVADVDGAARQHQLVQSLGGVEAADQSRPKSRPASGGSGKALSGTTPC